MESNRVAVSMDQYGIDTVVVSYFDELERIRHKFNASPDSSFFNGQGKSAMYEWMLTNLRNEDAYFNKHLDLVSPTNERWLNFLDDCAIFAVLSACLHGTPIYLIHPDKFERMRSRTKANSSSVSASELMQQLPTVLLKTPVAEALEI